MFSGNGSYTIQKDGMYEITLSGSVGYDTHDYLNGSTILYASNTGSVWRNDTVSFPLKAGAKLTMDAYGTMNVRLFE